MIGIGNDRDIGDDRAYNPLTPMQHFHISPKFFNWKTRHGFCERTASSEWNIIRAQIYAIHDRMLHGDSSTVVARQEMPPVIIPPLPKTGCEELTNLADIQICNGNVQNVITIAACVGAGMVVVPALFLIALTVAKWTRVVRPKKKMIITGKEAERKAAGLTGSGLWGRSEGHVLGIFHDNKAPFDERLVVGAGIKKAKVRIEEKEVWYGGVRMTLPWGRGQNWDRAVAQLPSKGTTRGMLVGMSPNSSSIYILEPGQFDWGSRAAGRSIQAVSEDARDDGTRVVSTSREVPTEGGVVSQRKSSGLGWAPDLGRREERYLDR